MFQNRLIAFLTLILATGNDCGGHAHSGHSAISLGGGGGVTLILNTPSISNILKKLFLFKILFGKQTTENLH